MVTISNGVGLCNNPSFRKCGTEVETSDHILCEYKFLASLRHTYLGSFILNREDIRKLTLQRGVTGTARMLHALTHSSISRQVREQM
jgi:hypothetical protein